MIDFDCLREREREKERERGRGRRGAERTADSPVKPTETFTQD